MPPRTRLSSPFSSFYRFRGPPKLAFSTSVANPAIAATYYEILNVPVTASTAEIKKQFYALSLRHHPDRNRSDPTASERFTRISTAYQTLTDTNKRAAYDRDNGIHPTRSHSPSKSASGNSFSSYSSSGIYNKGESYAGSRPASGLSQRRGPFRGPPPSFYAHGGYGKNAPPPPPPPPPGGNEERSQTAGWRAEEDPTEFINRNTVYHFNARSHFKTQAAEDLRRQARRSRAMSEALREHQVGASGDVFLRFTLVCGILIGTVVVSGLSLPSPKGDSEKRNVGRWKTV